MLKKILKLAFLFSFSIARPTTFTVTSDQTFTLDGDYFLRGASSLFGNYASLIFDSASLSNRNIVLDGSGYSVWCSSDSATSTIQKTGGDNLTITLTNIRLYNFDPVYAQSNLMSTTIKLGDNVQIIWTRDYTLNRSSNMIVTGLAEINLQGNRLTQPSSGSGYIDLTNTGTLTIKNGTLETFASSLAGSSTSPLGGILRLKDLKILNSTVDGNFSPAYQSSSNYTNCEVWGNVEMFGRAQHDPAFSFNWNVFTGLTMTVTSNSVLKLNSGQNLNYAPVTTGDGGNTVLNKRHFVLIDYSSVLSLSNSSVSSTTVGPAFDRGTLIIDGIVNFNTSTTSGTVATMELGSAANVEIMPSGRMVSNGSINFTSTTG